MSATIQLKRDLAANWTAANPILAQGEIGLETDTTKVKIGDGSSHWLTLSYWVPGGQGVTSVFNRIGAVTAQSGDYTAAQVGAIATALLGAASGVATLDSSSHVPAGQLALALLTANNLSELSGTAATARTNLGLGSAATQASSAFDAAGAAAARVARAGDTMTGWLAPAVTTLTFGATIAVNASLGNAFALTLTASTGTLSNPTSPTDGQVIRIRIIQDSTGSRTLAYGTAYDFGAAGTPTLSTAANKVDILAFEYIASLTKWVFMGIGLGY